MIYLISGLGADERVFSKLNFGKRPTVFLPWLIPGKDESMDAYLSRFSQSIDPGQEVILIGVSFGGIMAIELSKKIKVNKIILISSIKTHRELSFLLRAIKAVKLYLRLPSSSLTKKISFLSHYFFGAETSEEKKALDELIHDSDDNIINWSVHRMFEWKNEQPPEKLFHIHGTRDRIFPFRYLHNAIPVKNGTHFMVANKASEVSALIEQLLTAE